MGKSLLKFCNFFEHNTPLPPLSISVKSATSQLLVSLNSTPHSQSIFDMFLRPALNISPPIFISESFLISTLVAALGQLFEGLMPHILPYLPSFHLSSLLPTCPPPTSPVPYDPVKQNTCISSEMFISLFSMLCL